VDCVENQERTGGVWGGLNCLLTCFSFFSFLLLYGVPLPLSLAHFGGCWISNVVADRPRAGSRPLFTLLALLCQISLRDDGHLFYLLTLIFLVRPSPRDM